jgi:tetratricopeptide (TPR) repeat protein
MKKDALRFLVIVLAMAEVVMLSHWIDDHRQDMNAPISEERLYVDGATAKRLTFAFNGIAADWYWMRSLQYVGQKIVNYEDSHDGRFNLGNLSSLDLNLLAPLLRVTTTLDPQFMAPYEYGAVILPELNQDEAISLLNYGITANPSSWRLYHYLGYIYWQRKDYAQASNVYATGAKLPDAPAWMAALSARMKAEGGSRDAAREMYLHLYEASNDEAVKEMVTKQIMRLDSLDERDVIRRVLADYRAQSGRCASSWRDVAAALRTARLKIDSTTGAPLDPSKIPYRLIKDGCDVDLIEDSNVPKH